MLTVNKFLEQIRLDDLPNVAQQIIEFADEVNVWLFEGNLGAGKTTLIKELCSQLGFKEAVQSPTFSIVNAYPLDNGSDLYHFDCYRLNNQEEAFDFGIEEYLYSGNKCLIEWPEIIADLLPVPHLLISLEIQEDQSRTIGLEIIKE
ncbi:tRNA (adenosine(37)-N6)-threonylcarbamoyltransferase complex ATPase subunit type 1 TsaE [Arcticibacterium luteifluviistationis]|uniref:tRNA (adenosine(37)-N6)-threonylcarbamoyltransferase complex ATPase subunit type 1 TsaE n=1 Tax=Arcticibacterium luteifluviistationis TaxID=1784714 RepID=UPI001E3B782C|nr:tRNA (adenosine(37)-N6)-threonylcarbamoyltransferase complex ATPase subunit type 1 TsaE [Arcticibacterium luteifluviistationis]